jgi:hypothetical protein
MANINFPNGGKIYTQHVSPVHVDCEILIGSTGAVTSFTGNAVASVEKTATGTYKIHLNQAYYSCIMAMGGMQSASGGLSGIMAVEIQNAPSTSVSSSSDPSITIKTLDVTGAAAHPASGSTVQVLAILSNSSVKAGASI